MYKRQSTTMNELDVQLIREFALRPIIYDKSEPFFKNKYLTDRAWDEIAIKAGGDVNRVRDRVNQLRNRYNLEKRKVDLQRVDGHSNARSTWPLFEHLRFLDGHIRPRKSYKAMGRRPRPVGRPRKHNIHENDSYIMFNTRSSQQYTNPMAIQYQQQQQQQQQHDQHQQHQQHQPQEQKLQQSLSEPMVQVKTEPGLQRLNEIETNAEYDSDTNENDLPSQSDQKSNSDGEQFINPASFLVENDDSITEATEMPIENGNNAIGDNSAGDLQPSNRSVNLSVRSLNTLRNHEQPMTNGHGNRRHYLANSTIALDSDSDISLHNMSSHRRSAEKNPPSSAKYQAFGNFVSTSLIDLPENKALELVEMFTSEIVKALIVAKKPQQNADRVEHL